MTTLALIGRYLRALNLIARMRVSQWLERAAYSLYPRQSLQAAERDARRQVGSEHKDFFALLERTYNLIIRFNLHFHDRSLASLTSRERATLLLLGRIANALRRVQEDAINAYGPDACGHATSLFEFCWILAYLCGNEDAAREYLSRQRLSQGIDARTAISRYLTRHSAQSRQETEEEVYRRLNAFKHASPAWLSFHHPRDWVALGTIRVGPDLSPHGQWALDFALEMGSQLVLLALIEASSQLLSSPVREQFMTEVDAANQERRRLHATLQQRWMPTVGAVGDEAEAGLV